MMEHPYTCSLYDGPVRCRQTAVCWVQGPDGNDIPGGYSCWDHAAAALGEYAVKLGQQWHARAL